MSDPLNIIHCSDRIDRYDLLMKELASNNITDYKIWEGIKATPPYKGIRLAHMQIIQWAKDNNQEKVVIAEDDIKFTCNDSYNYFLKNEPKDYDIYLASIYQGQILQDRSTRRFSGLTLYMVKEMFYDTFLTADQNRQLDRSLGTMGRCVVAEKFCAIQHTTFSDNRQQLINYDHFLKGREMYVAG